jgi:amino acid adenylation domain-containing protein
MMQEQDQRQLDLEAQSMTRSASTTSPSSSLSSEHPLSYGQRALWFLQKLTPDSVAYSIARAARVVSDLDFDALRGAIQVVADHHPSLRTTFHEIDGQPIQRVHNSLPVEFSIEENISTVAQLDARLAEGVYAPYDLEHGPLLRMRVYRHTPRGDILLLALHHIAGDLWSLAMLLHDLGEAYSGIKHRITPQLSTQRMTYQDFVHAEMDMLAAPEGHEHWDYWRTQLAGELPQLDLKTDHPRQRHQTYRGTSQFRRLSASLAEQVRALAADLGVPLHIPLLTAFSVLLHRYTGQDDILIGYPKSNRKPRFGRTIGYFVNPIVIRAHLDGNPGFADLAQALSQIERADGDHDEYPLALLAQQLQPTRDLSRSPLFQAMFTWQKTIRVISREELARFALGVSGGRLHLAEGFVVDSIRMERQVSPFDITMLMSELGTELGTSLEYNSQLFDAATIARMLGHFQTLVQGAVYQPQRRVMDLPFLAAEERHQVVVAWNDTATDDGPTPDLVEAIEARTQDTPAHMAVICDARRLTYVDLNEEANRLAHHLRRIGVRAGTPVGVHIERSADAVVALLAVLKCGAVYVPLDPGYPAERLTFMVQDAAVTTLLTREGALDGLPTGNCHVVCLDSDRSAIDSEPSTDPPRETGAHLACVIYTSGSTGWPKGVAISYPTLARHSRDIARHYQIGPSDGVLQFASLSFDQSIEQILPTLCSGATVIMRGPDLWSPEEFNHKVQTLGITIANLPTAYWHQLVAEWHARPESAPKDTLKLVIPGGDRIRPEIARLWFDSPMRTVRLLNAYGPTETTVTATTHEMHDDHQDMVNVPIGRPLPNRKVYILDEQQQPTPIGVPGEIYIGGAGLAEGYLNQPELTAACFIPDRHSGQPGARLYRTGDLGRFLPDGTIDFIGRVDNQVKIRGFRVEPGEIETIMGDCPSVQQAIVLVGEDKAGKYLQAFVIAREGHSPTPGELREHARQRLPDYMVPTTFTLVDAFPLTPSAKIDRRALASMAQPRAMADQAYIAPSTHVEAEVAAIWTGILEAEHLSVHDDFFALGGHSLLAIQLCSRLSDRFQVQVPLRLVFEAPTIAEMSEAIIDLQLMMAEDDELDAALAELDDPMDPAYPDILGPQI